MLRWKGSKFIILALLAFFAAGPFVGYLRLDNAGMQQTFALAFLFGALALTYDLLFGFTGLLSFGHALFVASGAYLTAIAVNRFEWSLFVAAFFALGVTWVLATLIGFAALRTKGITFAMVTLAFGEAGHVIISKNFGGYTNGENGLPLRADLIPDFLVGVANTKYLYWMALIGLILIYLASWWITESSAGRVWQGLRDNEVRVSVIGLSPTRFKLLAFVVSATMAAFVGVLILLVQGIASPRLATAEITIALLLMVIIGGAATRWGAVLGGMIYSIASYRLQDLNQGELIGDLPKVISGPLAEPTFILGIIFILIVMFAPGGISGAYYRARLKYVTKKIDNAKVAAKE
jgi:branched-chain amino acid transport system permease protein